MVAEAARFIIEDHSETKAPKARRSRITRMTISQAHRKQGGEALSLAAILRDAANRSGLSVYRIAKESGVDQSTLNKFLNGDRDNLRLDVADRLFRCFGLQVVAARRPKVGRLNS